MIKTKNFSLTLLFSSFLFLQYVILRFANQAGRGFLPDGQQDLVYCFLQAVVISGFILHSLLKWLLKDERVYRAIIICSLALGFFGTLMMTFAPVDSLFYLVLTGVTVLSLGITGGAVYLRVSDFTASGARIGLCMGISYAVGIVLQYCLQLQWTIVPLLVVFVSAGFAVLAVMFTRPAELKKPADIVQPVQPSKLLFASVITFAMLIFTSYYNSCIHHLMIASGYTDYNVYSWPRFVMLAGIFLFGIIGELKDGRFLPISALCISLVALLNAVMAGGKTYTLNMCLYYLSLSASISYYNLTFLRLAPRTKHPALWASFGRVIDSLTVILSFVFSFSTITLTAVLVIDIASLGTIIVMMALNGDFNIVDMRETMPEPETIDIDIEALRERYGLTPTEFKVFRELVQTEDKQDAIASRLNISVNTLRHHITSIYRKTNTQTRSGLYKLIK